MFIKRYGNQGQLTFFKTKNISVFVILRFEFSMLTNFVNFEQLAQDRNSYNDLETFHDRVDTVQKGCRPRIMAINRDITVNTSETKFFKISKISFNKRYLLHTYDLLYPYCYLSKSWYLS